MLLLPVAAALGGDWPQYRGPNQDGISTERINPVWPAEGPKALWKVPLPSGYSSLAVVGDKVFTLISREVKGEMRELCIALDAATGKEVWAADITRGDYQPQSDQYGEKGGNGACSTPTVNDGKVYVYSIDMKLCCFEAQTGKEIWRVDVLKDHAGRPPLYGNSQSPVVDGDLVIVSGGGAGQSILGIHKNTGKVVWKDGDRRSDQSTPVLATILGERQAIFCLGFDLVGVSVKDGKTLWRQGIRWHDDNPSEPIVYKDQVRCGGANYAGSGLYQVLKDDDGFYTKKIWDCDHRLSPAYTTPVLLNGHLYGTFGLLRSPEESTASWNLPFKCIEFATNKVKWGNGGLGTSAGTIVVGDKLVILAESGHVVLAEAKPDAYHELARFKAVGGKCYSTPAFSKGRLYVRSTKEAACYDVSDK